LLFLHDFLKLIICSWISLFSAIMKLSMDGVNLRCLAMSICFSVRFFYTSSTISNLRLSVQTCSVGQDMSSFDV
jgi:hypothetical protein